MLAAQHAKPNAQEPKRLQASKNSAAQREQKRSQLLHPHMAAPHEDSRGWAWWAETPVLVGAKRGGGPYVHCESTGKSGGSLREGRKFAAPPLGSETEAAANCCAF